jgi:3-hydroxybutyryl-CoA dehydrogenase
MDVGVIGGGTMGRDIAYVHLAAGHDVTLIEADGARLGAAVGVIRGHFARRVERGQLAAADAEAGGAGGTPTLG